MYKEFCAEIQAKSKALQAEMKALQAEFQRILGCACENQGIALE